MSNPSPTLPPTPSTIANLPLATTPLSGNEFVPISQNGVTKAVAANGFTVIGPAGPAGPAGPTGPTGPAGGAANINTGTINDLAYYAATGGTLSPLATANSGILVTSAGGVPSIATAIPNGVTATTQAAADNSTKVATTAYVATAAPIATSSVAGLVKPDGIIITVSGTGAITVPQATNSAFGVVEVDGTTITASGGVISAVASGGLIHLTTVNASGAASVAFSSTYITNAYNKYIIEFDGVTSSAGSRYLYLTLSTNNGSTYLSSAYTSVGIYMAVGSSTVSSFANPITSAIPIDGATNYILSTSAPSSGTIKFANPSASATFAAEFSMRSTGGSSINFSYGSGFNTGTTAINNIMLALSGSGTITGNFHLYGLTN